MDENLLLFLQRIGLSKDKKYDTVDDAQKDVLTLMQSTFENSPTGQELIDKGRTERQALLIKKMKANAKKLLGTDIETDDIETLFTEVEEGLKGKYSKPPEKKEDKELSDKYRQLELDYQALQTETQEALEAKEQERIANISQIEQRYEDYSVFSSLPLTENAIKKQKDYFNMINSQLGSQFDRHEEGYLLKKGTQEPAYKANSTEKMTAKDFFESQISEFGIKKETDMNGGGNPNTPPTTPPAYESVNGF